MYYSKSTNTFFNNVTRYFEICVQISSIHGVIHLITKKSGIERLLWIIIIVSATCGYVTLAYKTWYRYQVNPTVITLDQDYYNWNVTFPTVTLCLALKDETIARYLETNFKNLTQKEKKEFTDFFHVLYTPNSFRDFHKIYDFDKLPKEAYLDTLLELTNDFKPVIESTFKMATKTITHITELGVCHAYNSEIAHYFTESYWKNNRWDLIDSSNETVTIGANVLGGMMTTISYFDHAFSVFFHSYNDIIDSATRKHDTKAKGILRVVLKVESMRTTQEAVELYPAQRNCRLTEESNLEHSPVYSYRICRMECRIRLCLHYCKCLPYFYRRLDNEDICDPKGMRCLGQYAGKY